MVTKPAKKQWPFPGQKDPHTPCTDKRDPHAWCSEHQRWEKMLW